MAEISKKEVKHISELANLDLSKKEIESFQEELTVILDYITRIQKVKTKKVKPLYQTNISISNLRSDQVVKSKQLSYKEALSNASRKKDHHIITGPTF